MINVSNIRIHTNATRNNPGIKPNNDPARKQSNNVPGIQNVWKLFKYYELINNYII